MAIQQENLAVPISEGNDHDYMEEDYEEKATIFGCSCFQGDCFRWQKQRNKKNGYTHRYLLHDQVIQSEEKQESWFVTRLKKLKEVSEVVAGPKWKNFIRRFRIIDYNKKKKRMQFQYDPQSYALNFDDGVIDREVDHSGYPDFSARYAAPHVGMMNKGDSGHDHTTVL